MPQPTELGDGPPALVVFRKTGGTPVPPGLCRPSYSQHTPAHARVQGLGAIFASLRFGVILHTGNRDGDSAIHLTIGV